MKSNIIKSVIKTPQHITIKTKSYIPEIKQYIPQNYKINRYFQPEYYVELAVKGWIDYGQSKKYQKEYWQAVHTDDVMEYKYQVIEANYDSDMELVEAGLLTPEQRNKMIIDYLK